MILEPNTPGVRRMTFPRTRGDDPTGLTVVETLVSFSPHPRG